ncbi:hypothetical protein [Paenibacillus soyae]|uniref:Hydrolase n=1 Tax=Paenibacillus soyae TaxID=2969249 RepID=A0A9X2SAP0_9BACL|nr:hypothetical protein [Paenibacillus soyae]MCR2806914.1 hypothetical protein [Paenibacillus soyae]
MGSRIMHYCITSKINARLKLDEAPFLLGGLAPDLNKYMNQQKSISHFAKYDANGVIYTDYNAFFDKYLINRQSPFHIGYYFHLISDEVWLRDIYFKKIKYLPTEEKKEAQQKYYRDFWRLNGKLIDHYSIALKQFLVEPVDIDEVDYSYLPELIHDLSRDFERMNEAKEEQLELLDFDEVIQVLEKSIQTCLEDSRI